MVLLWRKILCILGYGQIYGVNQSQKPGKETIAGTMDEEISQKA